VKAEDFTPEQVKQARGYAYFLGRLIGKAILDEAKKAHAKETDEANHDGTARPRPVVDIP
jgi:hypothetical protein